MTDSNFNDLIEKNMNDQKSVGEVTMRQKTGDVHRNRKNLSLIDEERLSRIEFEENEKRFMADEQQQSPSTPVSSLGSRIPVLRPTAVKGILKHDKGQTNLSNKQTIVAIAPRQATECNNITQRVSINHQHTGASCQEQRYSQREMEEAQPQHIQESADSAVGGKAGQTGLEYLEQTIREADQAVRESMSAGAATTSDNYVGLRCVDIDIGEPRDKSSFTPPSGQKLDKKELQTNTHSCSSNNTATSCRDCGAADRLQRSAGSCNDGQQDILSTSNNSSQAFSGPERNSYEPPGVTYNNHDMTRSVPADAFSRSTPNSLPSPTSTPEYKLAGSPHSPASYHVWTSSTLPLHSPTESPRHRLSQSGSPISPASGHQTIVYVPIITNNCKCCSDGHRTDPLRELVARRRRASAREDDQMSMASSIDSEIARYLVDYRSETGSNIDVLESRNSLSLVREDRIQQAVLERKRNFMRKRLERANKADGETRLKKGRHESYGFGSSAPRFEDIILTATPGTRSMSQLNLSAIKKSAASGDEADQDWPSNMDMVFDGSRPASPIYVVRRQDSPRPGSATPGEGASPRNNTSDSSAMYIARPLSKSTTNISNGARRAPDARPRRISAGTSVPDIVDHSLQQGQRRKPRISFSPVTLINSSPGGSAARAKSSERKQAMLSPSGDRLSRSSTRSTTTSKSRATGGGAPAGRTRSSDLPDNLKKSVARLSAAKAPTTEPSDKNKSKQAISASHTNLSTISKSRTPKSPPIELIRSRLQERPPSKPTRMGSRSMTTGDISRVGLSRPKRPSDAGKKPATNTPTDRKPAVPKPKPSSEHPTKSSSADNDASAGAKSSVKSRSLSATRTTTLTRSTEETSYESRSKTLDRPSKAQRAAKADAMSKSMYASATLASTSTASSASRMRKARSVGNISKAHLSTKKEGDTARPAAPRTALAKSKSTDPVKAPIAKKPATPSKPATSKPATPISKPATPTTKPAAPSSRTATPTGSKPSSKTATPGGSRRSSKDSNVVSPKGTGTTSPTGEVDGKVESTDVTTVSVSDITDETTIPTEADKSKETPTTTSNNSTSSAAAKDDSKKSAKAAEMEEYKAKLAEKRREAREKAEKEAEEERQRQEEARLAEEQLQREEEEKQRQFELDQERLAAEARQLEQERLEKAIEDEEKRRKEEAERLEAERVAKEEAAEKARADAEKREKEKQDRIAKEELEKQERKKKLEMIMKRVKTSSPTPDRTQPASEPPSMSSSMTGSMTSSTPAPSANSSTFKSPLLQGLIGNKPSAETTPEKKFSSPLLNNIMAKVSADRSEDNSSNSSNSSASTSQPNSAQTSPEHRTIPVEPSAMAEDNSQLSVELEGNNSALSINLGEDNSKSVVDSAILLEDADGGSCEQATISANDTDVHVDGGTVNINANNLNGNISQKMIIENGASNSTQNGVAHTHQVNGSDKSAGMAEEKQGTFEEVLSLSNKQSDSPATNPAPIIAFDDSSTAHTEGGDALRAANTPLNVIASHDQKSTSKHYIESTLSIEEKSWRTLDEIISSRREEALDSLARVGITEGDPDDESDEGQIWQMVEGRLPYTLDMV